MAYEKAIELISLEITKVGGRIFSEFLVRTHGTSEQKSALDAASFLNSIMTGEGIKKEWNLEESVQYKEYLDLANALTKLKS